MMKLLKQYRWLLAAFFFLLFSVFLLEQTKTRIPKENYEVMLDAAQRAEKAAAAIREEKLARGFAISPIEDPNQTGLIGEAYTEITTTLGSLEAKRSATNPNTAAMIVDMLAQCGVSGGDPVAVNLSSSFPGLNLSVLCALDAIGARGIIINSVGASTYGANLPDFTWLDMEQVLLKQNLIQNHSRWFSLGGAGDIGKEMPEETKQAIITRLIGFGLDLIYQEDLAENLAVRTQIYETECDAISTKSIPACLINAGGNLLAFGGGSEMASSKNGIIRPNTLTKNGKTPVIPKTISFNPKPEISLGQTGLIPLYLEQGVPVIHLLNMKTLLPSYGLPFDPSPLPGAGEGDVYTRWQYSRSLAGILLLISLFLLYRAMRSLPRRKMPI